MTAPMPTTQEIDALDIYAAGEIESFVVISAKELISLCAAARRGVEASVCPDCKNTFHQPFKCVTCGAQKLYDSTLLAAQQRAEKAEAECAAKDTLIADWYGRTRKAEAELAALKVERDSMQAKIDALMLEYCPDEMTPGQVEEWGKHQKPSPDQGDSNER